MCNYLPLYFICEAAGVLMIAGGILLIYKRKIYVNVETNKVVETELEFPFGVKLRTNSPALAFVALGFVPLIYPIWNLTTGYVRVEQELRSNDYPVTVYVGVGTELSYRDGKVVVLIPLIQNPDYKPQLIYRGSSVVDKVDVDLTHQKHGLVVLDPEDLQNMRRARTPSSSDVSPPPERFKERNTE